MRRSSRRSSMAVSLHQSLDSDTFPRASTRRSSIFVPPPEDSRTQAGNFTTKFSMSSFIKKVEDLTPQQRTAIENVGFGKLLRVPHHTLRKNLLVEWMERWESEKKAFLLLDRELTITSLDAALILGLRGTGKPIALSVVEPFSQLEEEYGADSDSRKISLSLIERRLTSLGTSADGDFVRTFLLFTFGTLLFHNSNGKVDSRYLTFLHDLSKVPNYAWGKAVVEDLFSWLCRKKDEQIKNMEGCLILLQIWSYEHVDIGRPNLVNEPCGIPRACRWESSRTNITRHLITTKFNELEEDQVLWKLQPVAAELNIQIIKELLVSESEGNEAATLKHLNSTTTKTSAKCTGLPPKSLSQGDVMDAKKKGNERGAKHDIQVDCPESSCLSTDASVVTVDYLECSSSYGMREGVEHQVVESSHNFTEDHQTLKSKNLKLEEQNVELRREIDALRNRLSMTLKFKEMNVSLKNEVAALKKENTYLKSCAAFIEELENITPEVFDGIEDVSPDSSF
ncbi:uncharacterized protein LOC141647564 [Silene latifolia]|uniref:uncharacterized protein LOC141647564 n=1 Tax=Silene latifolia TaxID=37657 RepID=UPI003D76AA32